MLHCVVSSVVHVCFRRYVSQNAGNEGKACTVEGTEHGVLSIRCHASHVNTFNTTDWSLYATVELTLRCDETAIPSPTLGHLAGFVDRVVVVESPMCCPVVAAVRWPKMTSLRFECKIGWSENATATHFPKLRSLEFGDAGLGFEYGHFSSLSIRSLSLRGSHLALLQENAFSGFSVVEQLDLSDNQLSELDASLFNFTTNLLSLSFAQNQISQLSSKIFARLHQLQHLNLSYNDISILPTGLFVSQGRLISLDLSFNRLSLLNGDDFDELKPLRLLTLKGNQLTHIFGFHFDTQEQLLVLELSFNQIRLVEPNSFAWLSSLWELHLDNNKLLTLFPGTFDQLVNVQLLTLNNNRLRTLPIGTFDQTYQLAYLDLSHNALKELSRIFRNASALGTLFLNDNPLARLHATDFETLSSLIILNNDNIGISELPLDIFKTMLQLSHLSCSSNGLTRLANIFETTQQLRVLRAFNNLIDKIESNTFKPLALLSTVFLHNNPVASIDSDAFMSCTMLQDLSLTGSSTSSLKAFTLDIPNSVVTLRLTHLSVSNETLYRIMHLPNLKKLWLGWPSMCSRFFEDGRFHLGEFLPRLSEVYIEHTDCKQLYVSLLTNGFCVVRFNPILTKIVIQAGALRGVDVSDNPQLSFLQPIDVEMLDISRSSLPYKDQYCSRMGTNIFLARNLQEPESFKLHLSELLKRCIRVDTVVDFSDNFFMNDMPLLSTTLEQPFIFNEMPDTQLLLAQSATFEVLEQYQSMPTFVLANQLETCSLQLSWGDVYGDFARTSTTWDITQLQYGRYICKCISGYEYEDGKCVRKHSFLQTPQGLAIIIVASVLLGVGLPSIVSLTVRSYRSIKAALVEEKQLLLEAHEEVEALRKAWEIDPAELSNFLRIDESSPGTFGDVYKAHWGAATVCVKVLKTSLMMIDDTTIEEFHREVEFLQRTRHPNLVRFFGAGTMPTAHDHDAPFLVLEFVENGSLMSQLQRELLTWELRFRLLEDIAHGMEYIHDLGLLHRDLKSANVLVTAQMRAKVSDFGSIAHSLYNKSAPQRATTKRQTLGMEQNGMTAGVGTPFYMSPEVLRSFHYGCQGDVFSFGVLMWEVAEQKMPNLLALTPGLEVKAKEAEYGTFALLRNQLEALEQGHRLKLTMLPSNHEFAELYFDCVATDSSTRPSFKRIVRKLRTMGIQSQPTSSAGEEPSTQDEI